MSHTGTGFVCAPRSGTNSSNTAIGPLACMKVGTKTIWTSAFARAR